MFRAKPKAPAAAAPPTAPIPEPPKPAPAEDFTWAEVDLDDKWGPVDLLMGAEDSLDTLPAFGYDLETCRRAVLHAWRGDYWPGQKINGTVALKRAMKTLVNQIPATFERVPTSARGPLHLPDPNCPTCEGTGQAGTEANEGYEYAPEMRALYPQAIPCTCWQPIGKPWRDWIKEQRLAGGDA